MTGAELKALIPDDCGVYIEDEVEGVVELMPEDLFKDGDGDIVIRLGGEEDEDEDEEEIEVEV